MGVSDISPTIALKHAAGILGRGVDLRKTHLPRTQFQGGHKRSRDPLTTPLRVNNQPDTPKRLTGNAAKGAPCKRRCAKRIARVGQRSDAIGQPACGLTRGHISTRITWPIRTVMLGPTSL